jgi:hypothetical protein
MSVWGLGHKYGVWDNTPSSHNARKAEGCVSFKQTAWSATSWEPATRELPPESIPSHGLVCQWIGSQTLFQRVASTVVHCLQHRASPGTRSGPDPTPTTATAATPVPPARPPLAPSHYPRRRRRDGGCVDGPSGAAIRRPKSFHPRRPPAGGGGAR